MAKKINPAKQRLTVNDRKIIVALITLAQTSNNPSSYDIAAQTGVSPSSVQYSLRKQCVINELNEQTKDLLTQSRIKRISTMIDKAAEGNPQHSKMAFEMEGLLNGNQSVINVNTNITAAVMGYEFKSIEEYQKAIEVNIIREQKEIPVETSEG